MIYGLVLVIESWYLHVSSVTQVLIMPSVANLDDMHAPRAPSGA